MRQGIYLKGQKVGFALTDITYSDANYPNVLNES